MKQVIIKHDDNQEVTVRYYGNPKPTEDERLVMLGIHTADVFKDLRKAHPESEAMEMLNMITNTIAYAIEFTKKLEAEEVGDDAAE